MADEVQGVLVEHVVPGFVREPEAADLLQGLVHIHERIGAGKDEAVGKAVIGGFDIRECPAYTLLYQFSPKDIGQSKVK